MVTQHQNYRSFLKELLADRKRRNASYSLRGMAKQLQLSPSTLSGLLSGKRHLSLEMAAQVAAQLDLSDVERRHFLLLVQFESAKSPELKESIATQLGERADFRDLSLVAFRVISSWEHFAILALFDTKDFNPDPAALAERLGISKEEVELAIERLLSLELLTRNAADALEKAHGSLRVASEHANAALRKYHRQTLAKASASLETMSPQEKIVGSETFAVSRAQLPEFRALSEEFFSRALALAGRAEARDEVFHLGVQFFPLTQTPEKL